MRRRDGESVTTPEGRDGGGGSTSGPRPAPRCGRGLAANRGGARRRHFVERERGRQLPHVCFGFLRRSHRPPPPPCSPPVWLPLCPLLAAAGWRGEHVFFSRGWVGGRSQSPATAGAILGAAVTLRGSGLPLSGVWGGLCVGGSPQEWVTAGPDALMRNGGALALEMGLGDGVSFPGDADWYCWGSG